MYARNTVVLACSLLILCPTRPCLAQEQSETSQLRQMILGLQEQMKAMKEQHAAEINALEEKIEALGARQKQAAEDAALEKELAAALSSEEQEAAPTLAGRASQTIGQLAPGSFMDISANVDMLGPEFERSENGFLVTDCNLKTSVAGVLAAGDVREKELRQVSTAVGEGAIAAMSAYTYLESLGKQA